MYSIILSLTSALGGGGWSTPRPGLFTLEKDTRYPLCRLSGPQGRSGRLQIISPGFDPRTVKPLASRYTVVNLIAEIVSRIVQFNQVSAHVLKNCKDMNFRYFHTQAEEQNPIDLRAIWQV
jgi:hypothetical protein